MIRSPSVLIDTWWNVNNYTFCIIYRSNFVLIDTWWNVNALFLPGSALFAYRFNRYMVECECSKWELDKQYETGFNRYMVECECEIKSIRLMGLSSFNRYMVECEFITLFTVVK